MRYHHSPIRHLLVCLLMRFLQSSVDAVYTNVKLQCVGAEDVYGTLQTELVFHSKDGSTFLPAYTDLCSESTKFDDAQRVYFCKNCLTNCKELVEQAPKNILIVADVRAPNSRVSWFHVQPQNMNSIRETGKQCNVENQNPNSSANMEETSTDALRSFSKTSVLFVSISFIILMVISLAWLVFYYVQRFRYAHAKDRLQRRLFNAARKALTRIPTMGITPGMLQECQTDCVVCLEPYALNDCVRMLPCKHIYHKSCIDPWLLEHRTCPMCKSDILKHFGGIAEDFGTRLELGDDPHHHHHRHHYHHHRVTAASDAIISPEANSESSDSQGFSFDHSEHTENFSFSTPTVAPQLVLNAANAKSFVMPMSSRSSASALESTSRPQTTSTTSTNLSNYRSAPMSARSAKEHRGSLTDLGAAVRPASGGAITPGQIVNLVQVKSRSASITRAATIRKESLPTPIEITSSIPSSGSSTSSSATPTTTVTSSAAVNAATSTNTQTV